jgi:hypothetical protein
MIAGTPCFGCGRAQVRYGVDVAEARHAAVNPRRERGQQIRDEKFAEPFSSRVLCLSSTYMIAGTTCFGCGRAQELSGVDVTSAVNR